MQGTLLRLMNEGGWVMWLLLGFSMATVVVAVQRGLILWRAGHSPAALLAKVHASLTDGAPAEALAASRRAGGPVGLVLAAGLTRKDLDLVHLESLLEGVAAREIRRLGRGLGFLALTAFTAPLLGFLGTVTGLMASFGILADFGMSHPDLVANGIREALTTTAAGLAVAVPAQLLHHALSSRLSRIEGDLEAAGNLLLDALCTAPGAGRARS